MVLLSSAYDFPFCFPFASFLSPVPPLCFLLPLHCFFSLRLPVFLYRLFSVFFICILCLNSETKPKLGLALCFLPFVPSAPGFFSSLCFLFPAVRGFFFLRPTCASLLWLYSRRMACVSLGNEDSGPLLQE